MMILIAWVITIVLMALKLTGNFNQSWFIVVLPVLLVVTFQVIIGVIFAMTIL